MIAKCRRWCLVRRSPSASVGAALRKLSYSFLNHELNAGSFACRGSLDAYTHIVAI